MKRRLLLWLLVLAALIGFTWYEQNSLQSEVIKVYGAPEAFDELRIALLSDVHGKEFGKGNQRLLDKVSELEPDLIALTGDLVHKEEQLDMVPVLARGLAGIAPTYYVTGNHEWAAGVVPELKALLEDCGVTVLSNEYVMFEREGQKLALLGADDLNGWADQMTIAELSSQLRWNEGEDCYQLLLSHRNNRYESYEEAMMDLTLAGHAHGGLIRLPFTDGLIGPHREFLPEYTAGRYDLSYGQMVVSRGLGNQFPAFRLWNRPHIPLVVLKAE